MCTSTQRARICGMSRFKNRSLGNNVNLKTFYWDRIVQKVIMWMWYSQKKVFEFRDFYPKILLKWFFFNLEFRDYYPEILVKYFFKNNFRFWDFYPEIYYIFFWKFFRFLGKKSQNPFIFFEIFLGFRDNISKLICFF